MEMQTHGTKTLTEEMVVKAQSNWAAGIVAIGDAYQASGDYTKTASDMIDRLYAYGQTPVLFKPTKAKEVPFRGTKEEALSYFVATNGVCAEDKGFAIQPWKSVRFDNISIIVNGDAAIAMGQYYFEDYQGGETKVEYTFGYKLIDGDVKIQLHHSSVPFNG